MSKIAFLFPGQGAQHVGMGRTIAARYPAAQALYDQPNDLLGYDLAKLCGAKEHRATPSQPHAGPGPHPIAAFSKEAGQAG